MKLFVFPVLLILVATTGGHIITDLLSGHCKTAAGEDGICTFSHNCKEFQEEKARIQRPPKTKVRRHHTGCPNLLFLDLVCCVTGYPNTASKEDDKNPNKFNGSHGGSNNDPYDPDPDIDIRFGNSSDYRKKGAHPRMSDVSRHEKHSNLIESIFPLHLGDYIYEKPFGWPQKYFFDLPDEISKVFQKPLTLTRDKRDATKKPKSDDKKTIYPFRHWDSYFLLDPFHPYFYGGYYIYKKPSDTTPEKSRGSNKTSLDSYYRKNGRFYKFPFISPQVGHRGPPKEPSESHKGLGPPHKKPNKGGGEYPIFPHKGVGPYKKPVDSPYKDPKEKPISTPQKGSHGKPPAHSVGSDNHDKSNQPPPHGGGLEKPPPSRKENTTHDKPRGDIIIFPPPHQDTGSSGTYPPPHQGVGNGGYYPPSHQGGGTGGTYPPPHQGAGGSYPPPNQGSGTGGTYPPPHQGAGGSYPPPHQGGGTGGTYPPPHQGVGGSYPPPNQGGGGGSYYPPLHQGSGGSSTYPPPHEGNGGTYPPHQEGGTSGTYPPPHQGTGGSYPPPHQGVGGGGYYPPPHQDGGGTGTYPPPHQDAGGSYPPPHQGGGGGGYPPPNQGGNTGGAYPPPNQGGNNGGIYPPPHQGGNGGGYYPPPHQDGGGTGTYPPPHEGTGGNYPPPHQGGSTGGIYPPPNQGGNNGGIYPPPHQGGGNGGTYLPPNQGGNNGGIYPPPHQGGSNGGTYPPPNQGGNNGGIYPPPHQGGGNGGTYPPPNQGGNNGGIYPPPHQGGSTGGTYPPPNQGGSGGGTYPPHQQGGGGGTYPPPPHEDSGGNSNYPPPNQDGGGYVPPYEPPNQDNGAHQNPSDSHQGGASNDGNPYNPNVQAQLLPQECGAYDPGNRIINGQKAGIADFPWMALLEFQRNAYPRDIQTLCGGTLISKRYVLTAAHCVKGFTGTGGEWKLLNVRLGEYDTSTPNPDFEDTPSGRVYNDPLVTVPIEEAIFHQNYSSTELHNDIAILRLSRDVKFTKFVQPICLAQSTDVSNNLLISGWGKTEYGKPSNVKLFGKVQLINKEQCASNYIMGPSKIVLQPHHICAAGKGSVDTCSGDSGGPLMQIEDETAVRTKLIQIGITSFGSSACGSQKYPGVYTGVYQYRNWILSHMRP